MFFFLCVMVFLICFRLFWVVWEVDEEEGEEEVVVDGESIVWIYFGIY